MMSCASGNSRRLSIKFMCVTLPYMSIGAPDIAGGGVADEQAILPCDAGDVGENIVEVGSAGLAGSGLLGDEGVSDIGSHGAAVQATALDRGHGVGDDIEAVGPGQGAADLLGMGEKKRTFPQSLQVDAVAKGGITVQCHGLKKVAETLYHQEIFSTLASVEGSPHGVVTALVEGKGLSGVGDIALLADGVEGIAVGGIESEESVIGIEKQVRIVRHK